MHADAPVSSDSLDALAGERHRAVEVALERRDERLGDERVELGDEVAALGDLRRHAAAASAFSNSPSIA